MAMTPADALGVDARGLQSMRARAASDPQSARREAAVQFESQFMQMVLKSMRDATLKADQAGAATSEFTGMLDAQFARQFAGRPGGLADLIDRQLAQQMRNLPPSSLPAPATAAVALPTAPASAPALGPQAAFVQRMLPHAQAAERATGVPASYILGQAALESGWGRGEIRHADGRPSHNLFGIKAGEGWGGDRATVATTEYVDGQPLRQPAQFRSYGSYAEAFTDYARLLSHSPRYAQALRGTQSPEHFAAAMQRAGYATDPRYADKLARAIHQMRGLQQAMAAASPARTVSSL